MAPLRVMLALVLAAHATGFVRASSRNFSRRSRPLAPAASAAPQSQLRHTQIACYDDDDDRLMSIRGGMLSPSRVTLLGAAVNVLLLLLKLVVGSLSGSAALVADAYHSGSDLLVDAVTMFAVNAPPAFERAAVYAIAGLLATTGGTLVWSSLVALLRRQPPAAMLGVPPLLVAVVAIGSKEGLYRITRAVGQRTQQAVLIASAKHHRSDAITSLAAALGAAGVLVGWPIADTLAAGMVGGMMVSMGWGVARGEH